MVCQAVTSGGGGRCNELIGNEPFHLFFSNLDAIRQLGGLRQQIFTSPHGIRGNGTYLGLLKVMDFVELSFEQICEFLLIGGIPIVGGGASLERTA